jgi:hypothetical protein
MKKSFVLFASAMFLVACGSGQHKEAVTLAKDIQSAIRPGTTATGGTTLSMTATIDGKSWTAGSMAPVASTGRIVGYKAKDYIGLPFSKSDLKVGRKIAINADNAADLNLNNGCLWKNIIGEMEYTKLSATAAEGRFFFSAECGGKKVIITNGLFRFPLNK